MKLFSILKKKKEEPEFADEAPQHQFQYPQEQTQASNDMSLKLDSITRNYRGIAKKKVTWF